MKKNGLKEFFAHENQATFDRVRKLRWNNGAMLHALAYYRTVQGEEILLEKLIEKAGAMSVAHLLACAYGALCAADENMGLEVFGRIYRSEHLGELIGAVIEGLHRYLPDPQIDDDGEDLDLDYPDTQAALKKKTSGSTGAGGSGTVKKSSASASRKSGASRSGE